MEGKHSEHRINQITGDQYLKSKAFTINVSELVLQKFLNIDGYSSRILALDQFSRTGTFQSSGCDIYPKMVISMECCLLAVFLMTGITHGIQGKPTTAKPLLFRSSSSILQYIFPKTETSTEVVIHLAFSTSKCGGKILDIPSRDTRQHYYAFKLESSGKLFFEYNILDGKFVLELNSTETETFCDANKHSVYLRRLNRDVYYRVDSGNLHKHVEQDIIQKPSLSKPDGVLIGGDANDKFAGCIFNASVIVHWTKLPESAIDLVKMYLDGNHEVSGRDLFIGACVDRSAECQSLTTRLHITRPKGIIAGPAPENNITSCTWLLTAPIEHRIQLTFLLLRVNNSLDCVDNHVEVMEGKDVESHMIGRYCNPKFKSLVKPIYSEGRHLTVVLNINSRKGFDFVAEYTSVNLREGPCPVRAELTGKTGTFSTPDFPYSHGNSKLCTWTIDVLRGKHVLITFKKNDFHIEGCAVDCRCDYLEVSTERDGRQYWYGRYCGFIRPSPIYITGPKKIVVKFFSDSEESRRGFRAKYAVVDAVENACLRITLLKNSTGLITSPRFPLPYPGQTDCLWAIKGPLHSRVKLTFITPLYLDMNCADYMEVSDGATKRAQTFMKKLCITFVVPEPVISGTRDLFVRFVSDKYQQLSRKKTGFVVKYEVLHGYSMRKISGVAGLTTNIFVLFLSIIVFLLWSDIVHP